MNDEPIWPVIYLLQSLCRDPDNIVQIWTARLEDYREITEAWLAKYNVPYHMLRMRPSGDFRRAPIIKGEMVETAHRVPDLMLEDHAGTAQLFHENWGIKTLLVYGSIRE